MSPLDQLIVSDECTEWRLKYRESDGSNYHNHLVVKESTIKGSGHGLFADRTFIAGDILTVYLGNLVRRNKSNSSYKLDFSPIGVIDAVCGIQENAVLYLGGHFSNDICHLGVVSDKRKRYNSKFDGVYIVSTKEIKKGTEIFVDYNRSK